jgi:hypothetical protein
VELPLNSEKLLMDCHEDLTLAAMDATAAKIGNARQPMLNFALRFNLESTLTKQDAMSPRDRSPFSA